MGATIMFEPLIESARRLVAKNNRYTFTDIRDIPVEERLTIYENGAWFTAARSLIIRTFGENSNELARWGQLQDELREERWQAIQKGSWNEGQANIQALHESMGLLTEYQIYAAAQESSVGVAPIEIRDSVGRLRADYPAPEKCAFIMMRFGKTKAHENIVSGINTAIEPFGITALRADTKQYHDDLFYNILTYIYGCGLGIAIFERIESEQFNPNVAMEVGYMFALRKPVCLLKERTLATLQTDLIGKLYRSFDSLDPHATIPQELSAWLRDKGY